jgi:hypothetical protein
MARAVYTKALLRKNPFCISGYFYHARSRPTAVFGVKQNIVLNKPSIYDASWERGGVLSCVNKLVQGAIGGVG